MENLRNWLYTLVSDIEEDVLFDALNDVKQVKIALIDVLKTRNRDLALKAQY